MGGLARLLDEIKQEGKLEGELKGKLEGKLEVAKKMLQTNMNIEQILEITGLTIDELKTII